MTERKEKRKNNGFNQKLSRICKQSCKYGFVIIAVILPLLVISACYDTAPVAPKEYTQAADVLPDTVNADSLSDYQPSPSTPEIKHDNSYPGTEELPDTSSKGAGEKQPDEMPAPEPREPEQHASEQPAPDYQKKPAEPVKKKMAYITIDDGPSRTVTPGILDILKTEGIKATFFVLPHSGVDDIYQRIVDEGHEIGNHSASHQYAKLYRSGLDSFTEDVMAAREFIYENFGYYSVSFRFPGGAMSHSNSTIEPRREILKELGYKDYDWNTDTGDANSNVKDKSAANLAGNILRNTRGREQIVVLMHDSGGRRTSLEALPIIIKGLREQGYAFDIIRHYDRFNKPLRDPVIHPVS